MGASRMGASQQTGCHRGSDRVPRAVGPQPEPAQCVAVEKGHQLPAPRALPKCRGLPVSTGQRQRAGRAAGMTGTRTDVRDVCSPSGTDAEGA